jgi:hypothetical protein
MSEKKKQSDIPEIEEKEAVTHESEPVSFEEMQRLQEDFYSEDLGGGLQNIQVPEEELERQRKQWEHAQSFIDMNDEKNVPCYRTDQVHLKLTPEQLVVLKEALEAFCTRIEMTDYLYEELKMGNLFEHLEYVLMLRDDVDDTLNEYLRHRPYSPFVGTWAKKIGKHELDKKDI